MPPVVDRPKAAPVRPETAPLGARRPLRPLALLGAACAALLLSLAPLPPGAPVATPLGAGAALAKSADAPIPQMEGRYLGIGPARGMEISITKAGRKPAGHFHDSNGAEAEIGGGWKQGGLEAVLAFPDRQVFVRLTPAAQGLQMAVLPLDPEGRPLRKQARVLAFLREGVDTPEKPALYQNAPKRAGSETDMDVFLASYQFWTPEGVANGFDNIGARYRTLLRLFPQVNADVIWKLCQADSQRALLAEALRGQGATCQDVVGTVERLQATGRFGDWKRAVDAQIAVLMPAVQCARGYIVKESVCAPASKRVAEAAVSLETLGTALARWK